MIATEQPTTAATDEQQQPQEGADRFRITDEGGANWYLRKLANLEAEKARVKAQAARIVAQIDADAEGLRFLYEAEVREWARQELEARGGRRRSITLLQGTLAFTVHAPTVKLSDPGAAMERAQELGTLRVDTDGYQKAAAAAFRETGELLPGVEAVAERETFGVRFPRDVAD